MSLNEKENPQILVFAGPNGSGRSTVTKKTPLVRTYVNADNIKAMEGCSDLAAAQKAEAIRERLLSHHASFTFETVLSTPHNLNLLKRAKNEGYSIISARVHRPDAKHWAVRNIRYNINGASGLIQTAGSDFLHLCRIPQDLLDCRGDFQKHPALLLTAVIQKMLHVAVKGVCLRRLVAPQERIHRHIQRGGQPQEGAEAGLLYSVK